MTAKRNMGATRVFNVQEVLGFVRESGAALTEAAEEPLNRLTDVVSRLSDARDKYRAVNTFIQEMIARSDAVSIGIGIPNCEVLDVNVEDANVMSGGDAVPYIITVRQRCGDVELTPTILLIMQPTTMGNRGEGSAIYILATPTIPTHDEEDEGEDEGEDRRMRRRRLDEGEEDEGEDEDEGD